MSDYEMSRRLLMIKMRLGGITMQEIADKFLLSRQRVEQILPDGLTELLTRHRDEIILFLDKDSAADVAKLLSMSESAVRKIRRKNGQGLAKIKSHPASRKITSWLIAHLEQRGISCGLAPYRSAFDMFANGYKLKIRYTRKERSSPSLRNTSPQWRFPFNNCDNKKFDFYVFITGNMDVFIIPSQLVENGTHSVSFCWPTEKPTMSKWLDYHEAYHLLLENEDKM